MGEQGLVRIMVEESAELILELERIGALWEREEDGKTYALRVAGGHSFYRCTYLEDRTGREMLRTLFGELKKRKVRSSGIRWLKTVSSAEESADSEQICTLVAPSSRRRRAVAGDLARLTIGLLREKVI